MYTMRTAHPEGGARWCATNSEACTLQHNEQMETAYVQLNLSLGERLLINVDGIPSFTETSSPELNDVLSSIRTKHITPSYLRESERRLIFGTKFRQTLADNPQVATVGEEEVPLEWMDRTREIPNRTRLLNQAVDLMAQAESKDWQNLPALLTGLSYARSVPGEKRMERIVRKAVLAGRLDIVVQCLQQGEHSGMNLQVEGVLERSLWGLHHLAQTNEWGKEAMSKAMVYAQKLSNLMETKHHGGGWFLRQNDPRRRPEVIGVFLELAAVYAYKHLDGKDVDGSVMMYAERLMDCIHGKTQARAPVSYTHLTLPTKRIV